MGEPTAEMRDRFTRVLKGHIPLALARFPEGTTGAQLDAFARRPLWEAGLDYDHGTGHGVGSYLSVHEGPQNISPRGTHAGAEARHDLLQRARLLQDRRIRHPHRESGRRARLGAIPGGEKTMIGFETITLAPIDLNLVEPAMLTDAEKAWLNAYHAAVRAAVGPVLADDAQASAWLGQATKAI